MLDSDPLHSIYDGHRGSFFVFLADWDQFETMRSFTPLLLSLLGATAVAASEPAADADSTVVSLTKDTFDSFVKEHSLVLAEFFAPWCGHCKSLAPKYEEAAKELKERDIPLVKVDCTAEEELCRSYEVDGYPTLKVFRGPDSHKPYGGARQANSYVILHGSSGG